jgi:hypothetical protein
MMVKNRPKHVVVWKNDKFKYMSVCYIKMIVLTVLYSHFIKEIKLTHSNEKLRRTQE